MMCELTLKRLCEKYNITYQIFSATNTVFLDTGLDEWQIKYKPYKERPFYLLHKNKGKNKNKFHIQRPLRTIEQSIDCIVSHKGIKRVLVGLHKSPYKNQAHNRIS